MANPGQALLAAPAQQDFMANVHPGHGFEIWQGGPSSAASAPPGCSHTISGSDFSQVVEITVPPGGTVTAEPGTMLYMDPDMKMGADVGGCGQGCKRCCCAGESFFRLHLKNHGAREQKVALTPKFPAKIVPVELGQHSGMIVNRGAFLGAIGTDWSVNLQMARNASVGLCGGQGIFMNTLHGSGMAFLNAGGTVMTKTLEAGETIVVDHHSILAFSRADMLGVRRTGGCMVCCCAGQGLFNATLTGPGFVMLHSMALAKLKAAVGNQGGGGSNNNGANSGGDS
eukprot:TRINITY_DN2471_c0_g1_i2.p1 TRINITY_DN2471_c0_g1~~TRINITY_DN2471_c0_g1_i2.p1  ORF type:complete len:284 (+),score=46.90 TRINITY_DN2471_c0_g1_i2:87-938(+)